MLIFPGHQGSENIPSGRIRKRGEVVYQQPVDGYGLCMAASLHLNAARKSEIFLSTA